MTSTTEAAFRTTVTVEAPIERAFTVFTTGFDTWWPRAHHIGTAALAAVGIEERLGGRWFERGVDGSECEWGRVLAWDPPHRVTLSWHLNTEFKYDPDPARASRVDVRFIADGPRSTRVEFEHRDVDKHGDGWPALLSEIGDNGGWPGLLRSFVEAAAAA